MTPLTERDVGVGSVGSGLDALLRWVRPTFEYAPGARPTLDIGYFGNVVPVGPNLGVAISTDGVGTKLLVAQAVGRFDTVGIDCVAMNVNDVLCVGARPIALVDYIALEEATPALLGPLGEGLARGCELAGVSCPGGELAQVREMLRGARPGSAVDLVGTAIGTVALDRVLDGARRARGRRAARVRERWPALERLHVGAPRAAGTRTPGPRGPRRPSSDARSPTSCSARRAST